MKTARAFWPTSLALLLSLLMTGDVLAEVYIYRGPNGERMISDRPVPPSSDYELLTQRDSLDKAGHILAKRRVDSSDMAEIRAHINAASRRFKVDPDLVEAVIFVESGFNPEAVSKKGATGLMQLMWPTAQQYQVTDRFDARQNIYAGVRHLKDLLNRFDNQVPIALAAYNAGAGAVDRYRGIPPFPETRRYVMKVLKYRTQLKQVYAAD